MEKDKVMEQDKRSFTLESGKTYFLELPGAESIRKADWHYSKIYNKALIDGVATYSEMLDILRDRKIYGPDYEKHAEELKLSLATRVVEMQSEADPVRRKELALEVFNLRDELFRWTQRLSGPLSNCCEQVAEDAKIEYLTSVVVRNENGTPAWVSYDEFINEKNQTLVIKSRYEVLLWLQGLDQNFLDKTPEKLVLDEITRMDNTLKLEAAAVSGPEAVPQETPENSQAAEVSEVIVALSEPLKKDRKKRGV